MTEEKKKNRTLNTLVTGIIFGGIITAAIFTFILKPIVHRAEIFHREDGPAVMRLYKNGSDILLVQKIKEKYIPSEKYLDTIKDKVDRDIEKIRIEKAAGYYK